jgi:signal transduction histidine kinase
LFKPIIQKLYKNYLPKARAKEIVFTLEESSNPFPPLFLDAKNISLAIGNLITNALSYTPRGGAVILSLHWGKNKVEIRVSDTGIGIPNEELPRLFNKFFRGSNAVKLETEGNGLGLFIVKNIVENHRGKIVVQSEVGKGSVFSLFLPIPAKFLSKEQYQKFIEKF